MVYSIIYINLRLDRSWSKINKVLWWSRQWILLVWIKTIHIQLCSWIEVGPAHIHMVKYISILLSFELEILIKGIVYLDNSITICNTFYKELCKFFRKGLGIKNTYILSFEFFCTETPMFFVLVLVAKVLFPKEFNPIQWINLFQAITSFRYSNMELFFWNISNIMNVIFYVVHIKNAFKNITVWLTMLFCDWGLHFPNKSVYISILYPKQDLSSLLYCLPMILILALCLIKILNSLQNPISQPNILIDPLRSLFDVSTYVSEVKDWLNKIKNVHDHKLYTFWLVV